MGIIKVTCEKCGNDYGEEFGGQLCPHCVDKRLDERLKIKMIYILSFLTEAADFFEHYIACDSPNYLEAQADGMIEKMKLTGSEMTGYGDWKNITSLQQEVDRYKELLLKVKCPDCDGSGAILVYTVQVVAGCCGRFLPSGECCGYPIPILEYVQDFAPCQWCAEREALTKA